MLEWQDKRTDEPGYKSTCNRFMVCEARNADGAVIWQTWKLAPGACWFALLANNLADEQAARAAADADIERRVA